MRKDIQRIAVALEKLAGMEGEDSDKEQISWLESEGELMEVQGSKEKGKQKEERVDRVKEEEDRKKRTEWKVWKKVVVIFLQSRNLSELGSGKKNFLLFNKCCSSCGRKWM